MKISTKSQYGLRAMVFLAQHKNKILPLKIIAKKEGISLHYLEKIISALEKKGLVKAKKGFQGGYFLAKKPEKIKIGEIIKALEKDIPLVKCLKEFCPRSKKCLAKKFWRNFHKTISLAINSLTLADLIEEK